MNNEAKIQQFLDNNHGYIFTSDFLNLHISKPMIKKYIDKGLIRKVVHGLYIDSKLLADEEYVLQRRYPKAIFSYKNSLSLLGFINELPERLEININSRKRVLGDYKVHYVSDKYYDIGIFEVKNMFDNPIKVYNIEGCICDMLKSNDFDSQLQNSILHNNYEKVNNLVEFTVR